MNRLVEEIIKPILEADTKIKKVVGIFGGRFQPFGPHHKKVYEWLSKQFDDAYITTSNIKQLPRHPMNFREKVRHMKKMGIPANKIVVEKSPFVAKNLSKKFNKDTTAFVYIFGAKDTGRLGGGKYFQDYKKNKNNLKGFEEHGYYLVAPHMSVSAGGLEVSGTAMRELLGSDKFDDKQRAKLFKKMFGYYDKGIFNMMTNKFKKIFEDTWVFKPTKMKKLKPKWKDGKGQELLKGQKVHEAWAVKGSKIEKFITGKNLTHKGRKYKEIDFETIKIDRRTNLITLRILAPKKLFGQKTPVKIKTLRRGPFFKTDTSKKVNEGVDLPIEIGDTIKMGRFKNKKVVVKDISWNEKGDLLINGRPALKFRITKDNVNEKINYKNALKKLKIPLSLINNKTKLVAYLSTNPQVLTQLLRLISEDVNINEFLTTIDMNEIIKEASTIKLSGLQAVDSGPNALMYGIKGYTGRNKKQAEKLGWKVIDYILNVPVTDYPPHKSEFYDGRVSSVSYMPAGIGTGATPNNKDNLTGVKGYNKWVKNMKNIAQEVGFQLIDFGKSLYAINPEEKELKNKISKDSKETLKQQKSDEKEIKDIKVEESVFSQDWWENILNESSTIGGSYGADSGEPDTGFIKPNKKRILGVDVGKPESWFEGGQYTQLHFPKADNPYGGSEKDDRHYTVKKKVAPDEEYEDLIDSDDFITTGIGKTGENFVQTPKTNNDFPIIIDDDIETLSKDWWKDLIQEELLLEGGAYGHMAHPFDDKDLTFGDLKKIIELGLGGQLNREDNVTEKLDGQNIMVSWKDGKLIAARNKGHIKNGGKTALTTKGIASKFAGRGDIADAFNFAMKDLEKAIGSLSQKQQEKIFNNGYNFMNLEVMWPSSANVIDYDKAELVFHGALIYDDSGTVKGEVKGSGRILAGMIKQVNMHIGKKYSIGKPVFLSVPKHQDFGKKKDKFLGKLNKLRNQYGLKDNDTLGLYHQSYWEEYIYNAAQQFGYTIPKKILKNLTKRWAFFDKKYKIPTIKKDLKKQPEFLNWVLTTDKNNHAKMVKENMKPFETLFFEVGAEILKNVQGFMAANPDKAVQGIRKRLKTAISGVKAGGDKKKLNTLKLQLDKLNKIGGVNSIVPSEGIVFKYKGNTYKFTGAFAPINQITGLINF